MNLPANLKSDLLSKFSCNQAYLIESKILLQSGIKEVYVLENYKHIKKEVNKLLISSGDDSFGVDIRKNVNTFGDLLE